jgi:hypothetical protein
VWQVALLFGRPALSGGPASYFLRFCENRRHLVAKPEWGTKQQCPKCGTRFYDLRQPTDGDTAVMDDVKCIDCGNVWRPEPTLKSKQPLPYEDQIQAKKAAEALPEVDPLEVEDLDIEDIGDDATGDVSLDDDDAEIDDVVDPKSVEE